MEKRVPGGVPSMWPDPLLGVGPHWFYTGWDHWRLSLRRRTIIPSLAATVPTIPSGYQFCNLAQNRANS